MLSDRVMIQAKKNPGSDMFERAYSAWYDGTKARTEKSRFESKLPTQDSSLHGSSCASNFRLVTATVQHEQMNIIFVF